MNEKELSIDYSAANSPRVKELLNQYLPKRNVYPKDWTESQKRKHRYRTKKAMDKMPKMGILIEYRDGGVECKMMPILPKEK